MGRDTTSTRCAAPSANFNPLSPHGERRNRRPAPADSCHFNPLSPHGERPILHLASPFLFCNFNPLSPHGERHIKIVYVWDGYSFQSTLPAWGETALIDALKMQPIISIHSPRMGRDNDRGNGAAIGGISIHSPRMGRDRCLSAERHAGCFISIHSPRRGRDPYRAGNEAADADFNPLSPHGERPTTGRKRGARRRFQSTLPAWGETCYRRAIDALPPFQSTLPAWGETEPEGATDVVLEISIHSPRMGRDDKPPGIGDKIMISIHSPRMGRDRCSCPCCRPTADFNPLSPHGERHPARVVRDIWHGFQSTLPAWGETGRRRSISTSGRDFNPLSPHGERLGL